MFLTLKSLLISNKNLLFILLLFWFLILLSLLLVYLWPGSWHFCTKCALVLTGLIFYSALLLLCNSKPRKVVPSEKNSLVPYQRQTVPTSDNLAFAKLFSYGVAINRGEEHLKLFVKRCKLTTKEEEVMRLLLCSDACIRDLSHDLMVSERVCQRHLTSIYEKTGTKSRLALLMKYYE